MDVDLIKETSLRQRDVLEQASREAALVGDGAVLRLERHACTSCRWTGESVWFNSVRGWVCTSCGEAVPGAAPTREQRKVGKPDHAVRSRLIAVMNGGAS